MKKDPETRSQSPRNGTLTRDDWIEAARKVLVRSGVEDVKVDRLARKLKVTRGSFYWHFRNRKDLLDALLDRWHVQNRREIDELRDRIARSGPDPVAVARVWLAEDPAYPTFDMAIRFWARKSAVVAKLVRNVDAEWIQLLQAMFKAAGDGELHSLARARIFYFHQIGYYALALEESLEDRIKLLPYYNVVLTGEQPPARELDSLYEELRSRSRRSRRGPRAQPALSELE